MEADNMIEEHVSKLWRVGCFVARNDVAHLGKAVDEYKKGVVTIRDRKVGDKVTGDSFPWAHRYAERH
jgi:hypothetical protein